MDGSKRDEIIELWAAGLNGQLSTGEQQKLDQLLAKESELKEELEAEMVLWHELDEKPIPAPSMQMDANFHEFLKAEIARSKPRNQWVTVISEWFHQHWQPSLAFMLVGMVAGYFLVPRGMPSSEINQLSGEVQEMKKMMMLTLIEQPKARERIKAVGMAREFESVDEKVIDALGKTLSTDENVNVRLAAIESLMSYWNVPRAREVLVSSIAQQQSPIIQSAIADAMITLGEKSAIDPLEALIDANGLEESVKEKLKSTINQLKSI